VTEEQQVWQPQVAEKQVQVKVQVQVQVQVQMFPISFLPMPEMPGSN
jgi:hypothetical protein